MEMSSKSHEDGLKKILSYWLGHNNEHINDMKRWLAKIGEDRYTIPELEKAIEASEMVSLHFRRALLALKRDEIKGEIQEGEVHGLTVNHKEDAGSSKSKAIESSRNSFSMSQIGTIRTPYENDAPYQPIEEDDGSFQVIIDPKYSNGLYKLETFKYIYVIYLIDRVTRPYSDLIAPSWIPCANVGIFASRSPVRPNRIGISIVKIKRIEDNTVFTTGLDVFDGTPLLDIKPYIKDLDSKKDANYGWIEEVNGWEHMILHLKGIPHDY